jgi:hypothetical protein
VDVILHPRRSVIDLEFATLEREVGNVFRAIQTAAARTVAAQTAAETAVQVAAEKQKQIERQPPVS